ncbi:MAG: hypothetical protein J0L64_23900 [Acidobacteria bacterium]|nr:hypothetical protein [Acidobacteriota bacterium]
MPARDPFLHDASAILETASQSPSPTPYTLLIQSTGQLHLIAESDWPLDRLAAEQGALRAYRVSHTAGGLSVDGCQGPRTCRLTSQPPSAIARRLLSAPALYLLAPPL